MKYLVVLVGVWLLSGQAWGKYTFPEGMPVKSRSEEIASYQMREYDKDKDGKLSLEEYESRFDNLTREDRRNIRRNKKNGTYKTPEEQFKEMDKDKDGFVDEQERAEYIRKLRDNENYLY